MRELPPSVVAALDRMSQEDTRVLVSIGVSDLEEHVLEKPLYRALHDEDVLYDGNLYLAESGAFSQVMQDTLGNRPATTLSLQNLEDAETGEPLPWSRFFRDSEEEFNGREVRFIVCTLGTKDDGVLLSERWYTSGARIDPKDNYLRARVGPPHDALAFEVPSASIISPICQHPEYGQGGCTNDPAINGFSDCPRHLQACIERTVGTDRVLPFKGYPFYAKNTRRRA